MIQLTLLLTLELSCEKWIILSPFKKALCELVEKKHTVLLSNYVYDDIFLDKPIYQKYIEAITKR